PLAPAIEADLACVRGDTRALGRPARSVLEIVPELSDRRVLLAPALYDLGDPLRAQLEPVERGHRTEGAGSALEPAGQLWDLSHHLPLVVGHVLGSLAQDAPRADLVEVVPYTSVVVAERLQLPLLTGKPS